MRDGHGVNAHVLGKELLQDNGESRGDDFLETVRGALPALVALWRRTQLRHNSSFPSSHFTAVQSLLSVGEMTSAVLGRLEQQGYIALIRHDMDRRSSPDAGEGNGEIVTITATGAALVESILAAFNSDRLEVVREDGSGRIVAVPHWHAGRRELRYCGEVVKRFTKSAPNQETLLAAFERRGWPERIDDPFADRMDEAALEMLHETIKRLNKTLALPLLRFRRDGTARGVCWGATARR